MSLVLLGIVVLFIGGLALIGTSWGTDLIYNYTSIRVNWYLVRKNIGLFTGPAAVLFFVGIIGLVTSFKSSNDNENKNYQLDEPEELVPATIATGNASNTSAQSTTSTNSVVNVQTGMPKQPEPFTRENAEVYFNLTGSVENNVKALWKMLCGPDFPLTANTTVNLFISYPKMPPHSSLILAAKAEYEGTIAMISAFRRASYFQIVKTPEEADIIVKFGKTHVKLDGKRKRVVVATWQSTERNKHLVTDGNHALERQNVKLNDFAIHGSSEGLVSGGTQCAVLFAGEFLKISTRILAYKVALTNERSDY